MKPNGSTAEEHSTLGVISFFEKKREKKYEQYYTANLVTVQNDKI